MWSSWATATVLFLLLLAHYHPSLSNNDELEPNLNNDCSWGSCSESQENPDPSETNPTTPSSEALGPQETGSCPWDSCPGGQVDPLEQYPPELGNGGHSQVQERIPGTLSRFTEFFPNFSKLISDGAKAAYHTVHRLSADVLEDIASVVRTVFSEEAYTFVSDLSQGAINSLFAPGA